MPVTPTGYAHVRLTVRDIDKSRQFYDHVFGMPVVLEVPPDADEATQAQLSYLFGGVIYQVGDSLFGLRPSAPSTDVFSEDRVGLDHISFTVVSVEQLQAMAELLDARSLAHEPIKDLGTAWILEFRDPDGIALELYAPASMVGPAD